MITHILKWYSMFGLFANPIIVQNVWVMLASCFRNSLLRYPSIAGYMAKINSLRPNVTSEIDVVHLAKAIFNAVHTSSIPKVCELVQAFGVLVYFNASAQNRPAIQPTTSTKPSQKQDYK